MSGERVPVDSSSKPDILRRLAYIEGHLQGCVVEGIKEGREDAVVGELLDLYELAGR